MAPCASSVFLRESRPMRTFGAKPFSSLGPNGQPLCPGLRLPFMEGYEGGTDTGDLGLHISLTDSNTHIAHIYVVLLSSHTCKQLAPLAPLAAPRATSHNPRVACSLAGSSSAIATATPRATAAAACSGLSNAHEIGPRGREETHATPEAAAPKSGSDTLAEIVTAALFCGRWQRAMRCAICANAIAAARGESHKAVR